MLRFVSLVFFAAALYGTPALSSPDELLGTWSIVEKPDPASTFCAAKLAPLDSSARQWIVGISTDKKVSVDVVGGTTAYPKMNGTFDSDALFLNAKIATGLGNTYAKLSVSKENILSGVRYVLLNTDGQLCLVTYNVTGKKL
jgi:hypothetical protein